MDSYLYKRPRFDPSKVALMVTVTEDTPGNLGLGIAAWVPDAKIASSGGWYDIARPTPRQAR